EYLPGSLQGKISSDDCLKKEQMVVSAIASTPQHSSRCANKKPKHCARDMSIRHPGQGAI
ncbi:hypothetical protein, partial [Shigella boydii]|uniref:hypothetical protein n=1 Tax=Shigella boydii TaxID=621 RepID=UPI001C0A7691